MLVSPFSVRKKVGIVPHLLSFQYSISQKKHCKSLVYSSLYAIFALSIHFISPMTYKETNLTNLFKEYLRVCIEGELILSVSNITMSFYSALNELDSTTNLSDAMIKFQSDFDYIAKTLHQLTAKTFRDWRYELMEVEPYKKVTEYYTIPEIAAIYGITQSAIRRACVVGKLSFKEDKGRKCKYLIAKLDIEQYMATSRSNRKKTTST